jgi:uncharacterized oligopeptide transporter (OPT) family protein
MATVMPSALGLLGAVPALELLDPRRPFWSMALLGVAVALFGILLGAPLRERYVVREPLAFPSAIATAEVMQTLHRSSDQAKRRLSALLVGVAVAAAVTWFRDGRPSVIPQNVWLPLTLAGAGAEALTLGVYMSPAVFSVGALVGVRTGLSLALGGVVAWGVLAPELVRAGSLRPEYSDLVSWLLWPGVALMAASSLTALATQWRTFSRVLFRSQNTGRGDRRAWLLPALAAAAVLFLLWLLFDVHPLLAALVLLGSTVLIFVCVRSAGETDIAPLAQLGQFAQLVVGLFAPGAALGNVASASIVAGSGASSAAAVSGFKAGKLVGAAPGPQRYAQFIGALGGTLVALPAYALMRTAHGLGTETLPVPGAVTWKALGEVAARGAAAFPPSATVACAVAAGLGVALTLLEPTRLGRFLPGPVALALGFIVPASMSFAVAIGACGFWFVLRRDPSPEKDALLSAGAAGGIAGESLLGFAIALLMTLGAF